jgi:hypothetical protein
MMIDDDTLKQLLRIDDETTAAMQVAERKARHGDFISPYTPRGRPDPHSDRSGQEQTAVNAMMMRPYKGYFIEGSALMVHPFSPDWYVGGSVLVPGRSSSIVEIGGWRFRGPWWTNAWLSERAE